MVVRNPSARKFPQPTAPGGVLHPTPASTYLHPCRIRVKKEIEKAEKFAPSLDAFIVATTLPRDTNLQALARHLTAERKKLGKFGVKLWLWEDTEDVANRHGELLRWYYAEVVGPNDSRIDPDQLILGMLKTAFSRPAFTTPMHVENGGADFLQAIIDTQAAINTGRLVARDREVIERAPNVKRLSNARWRGEIGRVSRLLQKARDEYTRALQAGEIRDEGILCVDFEVALRINDLRADALCVLNSVLIEAKIEPVDSPLLHP